MRHSVEFPEDQGRTEAPDGAVSDDRERRDDQGFDDRGVRHTRAGTFWVTVVFGVLLLAGVLLLILQNGESVTVDLGPWEFRLSLGAAVLLGVVSGAILVLIAGTLRIVQLRLAARRQRRAARG